MNKVTIDGQSTTQLPLSVPRRRTSTHGNLSGRRTLRILVAISLLFFAVGSALAQDRYLAIPSSGFTPQTSEGTGNAGYQGNTTGTARQFFGSVRMFAPANLPNGATITSLYCGGVAPTSITRLVFTLRRNEPQVANVDMVTVATDYANLGFNWANSTSVVEPIVDNRLSNYYVAAEVDDQIGNLCPTCAIGFCRIRYTQ